MDFALRCNSLKCRAQLKVQAVVTTCSHIFCIDCANTLRLSNANSTTRTCPACNAPLPNQDDAAVTNLEPTEDYKTSVLSGLNPSVIIECASRAMAFWTYQSTQEIFYQEFLMKSMTEKYQSLSTQMDELVDKANKEVNGLHKSLQSMTIDRNELSQKHHELTVAYRKKAKDAEMLKKLYQSEKQVQRASNVAEAAEEDASHLARQFGGEFRPGAAAHHGSGKHRNQTSEGSSSSRMRNRMTFGLPTKQNMPPPSQVGDMQRMHLPASQHATDRLFRNQMANETVPSRTGTPFRQPLGEMHTNVFGQTSTNHYDPLAGSKHGKQSRRALQRDTFGVPFTRERTVFSRQV